MGGRGSGLSIRAAVLAGTLLVALPLSLIFWEVHTLELRTQAARSERDRLAARAAEREGAEERLRADRERLAALRVTEGRLARWDEERFLLPELLRGLSDAVPDAVVLEEIRREGPNLRITGQGASAAVVAEAARAFSGLERIRETELLWVEQVEDALGGTGQRFSLAGGLHYTSREPEPFAGAAAAGSARGPGS